VKRASSFALAAIMTLAAWARADDDDARQQRARELYEEGAAHYQAHEYEAAVEAFKSAYAIAGRASLLFNVALAYEEWGSHCPEAKEFYAKYLELKPDAKDRDDIEKRLTRLRALCPSKTETTPAAPDRTPPPPAPESPPPTHHRLHAAPLGIAAAGLGVGVAGAVMYGAAAAKPQCPCPPSSYQGWEAITDVSYVLMAIGGAAIVTGGLWFAIHPRLVVRPTIGGLVVEGKF